MQRNWHEPESRLWWCFLPRWDPWLLSSLMERMGKSGGTSWNGKLRLMASWGPVGTEDQEPETVQADSSLHPTLRRIPTSLHWPTEWSYAMARVGQEKDRHPPTRHSELRPRAVTPVPAPGQDGNMGPANPGQEREQGAFLKDPTSQQPGCKAEQNPVTLTRAQIPSSVKEEVWTPLQSPWSQRELNLIKATTSNIYTDRVAHVRGRVNKGVWCFPGVNIMQFSVRYSFTLNVHH